MGNGTLNWGGKVRSLTHSGHLVSAWDDGSGHICATERNSVSRHSWETSQTDDLVAT